MIRSTYLILLKIHVISEYGGSIQTGFSRNILCGLYYDGQNIRTTDFLIGLT